MCVSSNNDDDGDDVKIKRNSSHLALRTSGTADVGVLQIIVTFVSEKFRITEVFRKSVLNFT